MGKTDGALNLRAFFSCCIVVYSWRRKHGTFSESPYDQRKRIARNRPTHLTPKWYPHTKNGRSVSMHSKFRARTGHTRILFHSCDLGLDPMTFMYELDLTILKIYLRTKNELFRSKLSKLQCYRETHAHDRKHTTPHLQLVETSAVGLKFRPLTILPLIWCKSYTRRVLMKLLLN